jgi:two-component system, OmpR family, phosphate regulon sensor histidine kinase PhoR
VRKKALEQEIAAWQHVIQQAPVGYLQVDEENRLYFCNAQACELLGIRGCEGNLDHQKLLLQLVRSYELDKLIEETRSSQQSLQTQWVFHPVIDDPLFPVELSDRPLKGRSVVLANGHIGIFIEDRQEATKMAQQRDRWAADVAHDLKTPLTSIRLIAETLQSKLEPPLRTWIDRLLNEAIRLSDVVQDLLDLGQVDMGMPLKLNLKTFDLVELIQSAWQSLEPLASKHRIRLEYEGENSILIEADQSRIYRMMMNLLENSIKHSPSLQIVLVKVDLAIALNYLEIQVIDSGDGFPEEVLPHVFDRFFQGEQTRSRSDWQHGSGLGLAIVRQIVQSHKGAIAVANHPETSGAWITVTLPIQKNFESITKNLRSADTKLLVKKT